jgi:homospermidine synthase
VPTTGAQSAYLITHHESLSIAAYFNQEALVYRPTVYYAYNPCAATQDSLRHWCNDDFKPPQQKIILRDTLSDGADTLGVWLISPHDSYWYGSHLTLNEARAIAPFNSATSLQVVAGILGAIDWMLAHPDAGIIEAEEMDHEAVLHISTPYLGQMIGMQPSWHPDTSGALQFADFYIAP